MTHKIKYYEGIFGYACLNHANTVFITDCLVAIFLTLIIAVLIIIQACPRCDKNISFLLPLIRV